jgi:hypothetical protein
MWFTFVMAHLSISLSFQPRLAATLLRSCSAVNSLIRRAGFSPAFQPASLAQRLTGFDWLDMKPDQKQTGAPDGQKKSVGRGQVR